MAIKQITSKHYYGSNKDRLGFIGANLGDTFYVEETKEFYIFYYNTWNLVSGNSNNIDVLCIDGGDASNSVVCI